MVDLSISTSELEYFLLIFIRMTAFLHLAPFYGEQSIPSRVKVTLGLFLAYLVYTISEPVAPVYDTVTEYAILVIKEVTVGLMVLLIRLVTPKRNPRMAPFFGPRITEPTMTGITLTYHGERTKFN